MKISTKMMVMAILLAGSMSFAAKAAVFTAPASDATYIKSAKATKNFTYIDYIRVESDYGYHGVVGGFTLPDLGGASLLSATLRVQTTSFYQDGNGDGIAVSAYRLGQAWAEGTVTWNFPAPDWAQPGFLGTAATPSNTVATTSGDAHWEEWNVTADVADMYANVVGNYGWTLRVVPEANVDNRIDFWTSRHVDNTSNQNAPNPELVITTAPIPEPGSLFLLGTGLLSLVSFVRRKRS